MRRPIQSMASGNTLRILNEKYFSVTWTDDGWQTVQSTGSKGLGSAGFSADIKPRDNAEAVEWTLHYPEQDAWLGYNVRVKIDAE